MTPGHDEGPPAHGKPLADTSRHQATESDFDPKALRRRAGAAQRLVRFDCGCIDPWICHCRTDDAFENSPAQLDAWVSAASVVLAIGCVPIINVDILRALWRRGGDDRRLAQDIAQKCGAAA